MKIDEGYNTGKTYRMRSPTVPLASLIIHESWTMFLPIVKSWGLTLADELTAIFK
jgi:hypothetical protein